MSITYVCPRCPDPHNPREQCGHAWTGRVPRRGWATHSGPDHGCCHRPGHSGAHECACGQEDQS